MSVACPLLFFLEIGAFLSLKLATQRSFRGKKIWKFKFSGYFLKAKMEECGWKYWFASDKFAISIPCVAPYFLEVGARVLLKVATKLFLEVKKSKNVAF